MIFLSNTITTFHLLLNVLPTLFNLSSSPWLSSKSFNYSDELKRVSGWVWWGHPVGFFIKELSRWAGDPFRVTDHYRHPVSVIPHRLALILNVKERFCLSVRLSLSLSFIRFVVQKGFNKAVSIRPAVSSFTITGSFTRKNNWPVSLCLERGWAGWDLPPPLSFLLPPPDDKDNQILPYGELGLNCFSICWPGCFFFLRVLKMCSDIVWIVHTFW